MAPTTTRGARLVTYNARVSTHCSAAAGDVPASGGTHTVSQEGDLAAGVSPSFPPSKLNLSFVSYLSSPYIQHLQLNWDLAKPLHAAAKHVPYEEKH